MRTLFTRTSRSFRFAVWLSIVLTVTGCISGPPAATPPGGADAAAAAAAPTSASVGETTLVAIQAPAPPAAPHATLPQMLGLSGMFRGVGGLIRRIGTRIRSRLGMRFPGLEPKPPLLPISDPANLDSPNPAVKAAAEVKQEEDAAPQKIKAIRYLASVGCSDCYPSIESTILEAMSDCTEAIRYEAVRALRGTAGDPCQSCTAGSCCSPKIQEKLQELAQETDSSGCYLEPSARVRREARLALRACGEVPIVPAPEEGPSMEPTPAAEDGDVVRSSQRAGSSTTRLASARHRGDADLPAQTHSQNANSTMTGVVLARVDSEPIYEHDILAAVDVRMAKLSGELPARSTPRLRQELIRQETERAITRKLLCQEASHFVPEARLVNYESTGGGHRAITVRQEQEIAARWLKRNVQISPTVSEEEIRAIHRLQFQDQPIESVRDAIREAILRERKRRKTEHFVNQLRAQANIWSVFDVMIGG